MKKILVISNGPFPTPEQDKVEGGGLRCWGLASGLKSQKNLKVVAAYNEAFKKDNFTDEYLGIEIKTWKLEQLTELISEFDSVLEQEFIKSSAKPATSIFFISKIVVLKILL